MKYNISWTRWVSAVIVGLSCLALSATDIDGKIRYWGDPRIGDGGFYGYRNGREGPGADSFRKCRELALKNHVPLFLIWGKDGCAGCNEFANMVNIQSKSIGGQLAALGGVWGYFRGNAEACSEAREFFDSPEVKNAVGGGAARGGCHLALMYVVYEDGTAEARTTVLPTSGGWASINANFYTLLSSWNKTWRDGALKHKYQPPKASACFDVGTLSGARLEAQRETKSVFVPLRRTNDWTKATTEYLVVNYPDGRSVTNDVAWTSEGPTATNLEVEVSLADNTCIPAEWRQSGSSPDGCSPHWQRWC